MSNLNFLHSGGNKVTLSAPASNPSSDITFKLPQADGSAGQVLRTDGSGNLSWVTRGTATTNGTTEYDIYRLAANYTIPASNTTITQTMVRPTLFFEKIGSGMSVSSGIFTFPSTGKYEIQAFFQGFQSNGNDNIFKFNMDATNNNSSYQEVVNCREGNYDSGRAFSVTFTYLIDITNTSTHKVRFGTTTAGSNRVQLDGNSASTILDGTYFVFKKVGDT